MEFSPADEQNVVAALGGYPWDSRDTTVALVCVSLSVTVIGGRRKWAGVCRNSPAK